MRPVWEERHVKNRVSKHMALRWSFPVGILFLVTDMTLRRSFESTNFTDLPLQVRTEASEKDEANYNQSMHASNGT
jgi:hypothetical protein